MPSRFAFHSSFHIPTGPTWVANTAWKAPVQKTSSRKKDLYGKNGNTTHKPTFFASSEELKASDLAKIMATPSSPLQAPPGLPPRSLGPPGGWRRWAPAGARKKGFLADGRFYSDAAYTVR